jgi:KaiC/GvpD/RAD55 family RecA-like ATPase
MTKCIYGFTKELDKEFKKLAKQRGWSLSQYVINVLLDHIKHKKHKSFLFFKEKNLVE